MTLGQEETIADTCGPSRSQRGSFRADRGPTRPNRKSELPSVYRANRRDCVRDLGQVRCGERGGRARVGKGARQGESPTSSQKLETIGRPSKPPAPESANGP